MKAKPDWVPGPDIRVVETEQLGSGWRFLSGQLTSTQIEEDLGRLRRSHLPVVPKYRSTSSLSPQKWLSTGLIRILNQTERPATSAM
jgi:hypothetical protein